SGNPNYLPGTSDPMSQRIRTAPDSSADGSTVGDSSIATRDDRSSSAVVQVTFGVPIALTMAATDVGLATAPPRSSDGSSRKLSKPAGSPPTDVVDRLFSLL